MSGAPSLPSSYFDDLYGRDPDPWRFETSDYERAKYADTLAALPRPRYGRVLEVGCSIGVLTAELAGKADHLLATDVAEAALAVARKRLDGAPQVRFERSGFPDDAPEGPFDLIVLSEVLYYLSAADLRRAAAVTARRLAPGGEVLLVHWLGETPDYPLTGDEAADGFLQAACPPLTTVRRERRERYRLELLRAPA